ncbi:MAG TPA: ABC transporter substrate-binding protein [Stellaceae bacterium]|nr:ABC transporter substrate-binding protein [Stellaceae bacterium]
MSTDILRSVVRAAFAVALGSAFMALPASAATTLTVGKAAPNADPIIPVDVGYQVGIFKKHGLDLKIVDFLGGSKMAQAMAAGSIDIGDGAGTEMALVAKGVPMLAVCESSDTFPFLSIGVPWDSPIKSMKELKGTKIGISSPGSLTDWLAQELARKEGWAPDELTNVAIGNGAAGIIAAFREHLIDADIGTTSLFLDMQEKKAARLLVPVSDYEGGAGSGALYASNHLIDTDPGAVRAFVAGWIETIDYIRAHKAETVKIESGVTGLPESVMSKEYDLTIGMFTKGCKFDAQSLATLKRTFADLKLLDAPPDMAKLYTEAFLPK